MDKHRHDDAGAARQERYEPSDVPAEASQHSVPAEELSPDEAAIADADRTRVPDPTSTAQVPDSSDLPEDK
ncbi:MAG TPA: hypothetical protein VGW11_09605 [Solirubrobacteraceae bacterium]|nr:hypothetical protein [Solirubrobacteraceae bacterium]